MGASTKAAEGGKNKYKRKETPSSSSPKDKYNKDKKKHKIDVESTIKNPNNSNYEDNDLSNSALKRQAKKERQSQRRHADVVTDAKFLWNKIRIKSNTPEQTSELMDEIMSLIKGKVTEIALQHDASRVVQAAIQFGTDEQRYDMLKEICENDTAASTSTTNANTRQLVELSKIQYAHFVCLKFIKYCHRNPDCVKLIVKSFKGSIPKLAVHSVGARVVESLFLNFPHSSTSQLKHEFFGPHFNLFSTTITDSNNARTTLKTVIDSAKTDTQKESALQFVKEIVTKGTTKQFFGYNYFQEILSEYLDYLAAEDPNEIRNSSIVSSLVDHSIHLLSTRSGAKVVALCASYGTPKDRKRICKSLKGFTRSTLLHRDAYLALLKLIQVTDDTVSIHKSIFNEILTSSSKSNEGGGDGDNNNNNNESPFLELGLSETASKLFILLLVEEEEKRNKYFDPYEQSVLCHEAYSTENGKKIPTSKKDTAIRRKELLNYLNMELSNVCIQHADQLLTSLPGSRIIKEVYDNDAAASKEKQQEIVKAIVDACEAGLVLAKKGDDSDGDHDDGSNTNFALFEDPTGHRSVKNLFLCDATKEEPTFTMEFMDRLGDQLLEVAKSNRGAFVVTALLKVPKVKKQVKKQLSNHKKELKKAMSSKGGATSGYEALLTELSSSK